VQLFNVLQCGLKMERIDSEGLLGVNLTGGRRININGVGRAARRGRVGVLSSFSEGNFKDDRAGAGTSRGMHTNRKGGRQVGGRGRLSPTRTSGGIGVSIPDIIDEVCTSELVEQLHQVGNEFHGDGLQNGFGKMKVGFTFVKVFGHILNLEGLKGSTINEVKGGVGVKGQEEGAGV